MFKQNETNFFNKSVAFRVPDSSDVGWPLDTIYGSGSWLEEMWAGSAPAQNLAAGLHGWATGCRSNSASVFFTTRRLDKILWLIAEKKIQQQYIQSRETESLELEGGGGNKARKMTEIRPT